jgi:hypothetical protein
MAVNVIDFGADPTGVADSQPAFKVAMLSFTAAENAGRTLEHGYGGRICVPYGTYRFAQPLYVNRSCIFEGDGDVQVNTTIRADPGVTPFIFCSLGTPWGTTDLGTGGAAQLRHMSITQSAKVAKWCRDTHYNVGDKVRTGTAYGEDWRRHLVCTRAGTSASSGTGPRSMGYDQELTVSGISGTFVKGERINGTPYLYDGSHTKSPGAEITAITGSVFRLTAVTNVFTAGDTVTGATSGATATVVSSKYPFAILKYKNLTGAFQTYNGKVITGATSGATANIQFDRNGVTLGGGSGSEPTGFLMINNIVGTFIDGETITDRYVGNAECDGTVITDNPLDELDGDPTLGARWTYLGNGSGVQMFGRAGLDRVSVFSCSGNGIHIEAQSLEQPNQLCNANGWSMSNMTIYLNDGHGLYINGSDANAGYFIGGDLGSNGSPVSDHAWTGIGYNIYDSSFLGNTYVQAQMASGGIGSVFNDSVGGGGTFVGCYVEGAGGGESRVGNGTTIIGGGLAATPFSEDSTAAVFGVQGQHGANYLVKGFNASAYDGGTPGAHYRYVGIRVSNAGNVYRCITPGIPAGIAPTGTGADIVDGQVHWAWLGAESLDGFVSLGSLQPGAQSRDFFAAQSPLDVVVSLDVTYRDRDIVFGPGRYMHVWEFGNTSLVTYGMSHNRTILSDWPMQPRPAMAILDDVYVGSTRLSASATSPAVGVPTYLADTWNPGDIVWTKAAAVSAGGPMGWRCTVGGTFNNGRWTNTRTATSTGTAQIVLSGAPQANTLNFQKEVMIGDYLLVNGVTVVHVTDATPDGLTLTTDVTVPVGSGLSISPRPPTFEQIIPLTSGAQIFAGNKTVTGKVMATAGIGVGNSAAATTLGSVVKKIEVFDASGNPLGFIPVYDSIT